MRNAWRAACLAAVGAVLAGTAAAETIVLQAAHLYPEDHVWHKGFLRFAEVLKAAPGADLDVAIHARGTWGSEADYIHSLRQGLLDIAVVPPSAVATVTDSLAFLDTMFLWRNYDHWARAVDGPVGERIAELIEAGTSSGDLPGVKVLGFWGGTPRHILSRTRTYPRLADLQGFRVGMLENPMNAEIWRSLGAIPVAVPLRNSIALLQADIVEGLEAELGNAAALKVTEVAPNITLTGHAITLRPFVMSDARWRKLTPQQQVVVSEAASAATALVRELTPKQEEAALAALRASGAKVEAFAEPEAMRLRADEVRRRLGEEAGLGRLMRAIENVGGPSSQ